MAAEQGTRIREGRPEPRGVSIEGSGVNVAVYSAHAEAIEFCIFGDYQDREIERVRLPGRTGDVFHGFIDGVRRGTRYGLRAYGPYAPQEGHRFNPAKLLLDPYALRIDRPLVLDPSMFGFVPGRAEPSLTDNIAAFAQCVVCAPDLAEPWNNAVPWERTVIAELHVRGFTMTHPGVPEKQRGTFAGLASPAVIAHLKALGITTVELLPAAASLDERHLGPLGLTNYWNYNPVAFLAPDPRLAPGGFWEIRQATAALNAAGIEVVLDVVYNHSGEGDEVGPTVSLRGLDNASYYRLDPADRARYVNDAGCGNILAADHPEVVRLVMEALRAWVRYGGINGFRFDLATILGRRASGFEAGAPLLSAIEQDPTLRTVRLIAEPWDIGPGGYQVGAFAARWGEWNDRYRDDVRRFWRGDGTIADLATRLAGSADLFWAKRRPSRSINFVTAHDGFTLADLVSFERKHNEANGEGNHDGTENNYSWNNGIEGPTDDPAILAARGRDQRNLLATLMLSRGTPMLGPGSETGGTQGGNNNAYSQDNALSWTDWANADPELPGFIAHLTALRAAHPAITHDRFLTGKPPEDDAPPDVVWRLPDGTTPGGGDWHQPGRALVAVLSSPGRDGDPDRILLAFNPGREAVELQLPSTFRSNRCWRFVLDTSAAEQDADRTSPGDATVRFPARTVMAFVESLDTTARSSGGGVAPDVLDRLAVAAGIAPDWTEINGQKHQVPAETKQAILCAMGLPAGSTAEARDSLHDLTRWRDRRLLPRAMSVRDQVPFTLRLADAQRFLGKTLAFSVRWEQGHDDRVVVKADEVHLRVGTAADGSSVSYLDLPMPAQPWGCNHVIFEDAPDLDCTVTVAPPQCYLPDMLAGGGRALGIAAHLYTLRRAGDAGIGDFTTLGEFSEVAARHGAKLVGINPIHAMFATDRERASPYNPSDRRFLDPIYLDVDTPEILGLAGEVEAAFDREAPTFARLRESRLVDYPAVWAGKRRVLEAAFAAFEERGRRNPADVSHREFARLTGPDVERFSTFQVLAELESGKHWQIWPEALRDPDSRAVAAVKAEHASAVRFHCWLQWLCNDQLSRAVASGKAAGLSLGLYGDLAVGCAPDGAEAWSQQGRYVQGVSVGSPPDPFSANGQVWSLPPPNPIAYHRLGNTQFQRLLSANMRHAGALRIDHAMGLSRLFWVPDGMPGSAGAYVGYDLDANLAEVALASMWNQCIVIGEDLGTVPQGFRERLADNDILSYRVLFFERGQAAFKPARSYPRKSVACVATHDLAPLAGWWRGSFIDERLAVGQIDEGAAETARQERAAERRMLAEAVGQPTLADRDDVAAVSRAVHTFVAEAPSMLIVAQADDLVGEEVGVNLPGTDRERPNWRRRLNEDSEAIFARASAEGTLPDMTGS